MKKLPLFILLAGLFACGGTVLSAKSHDKMMKNGAYGAHDNGMHKSMKGDENMHHMDQGDMAHMMMKWDRYDYFVDEGMVLMSDNHTNTLYMLMPEEKKWMRMDFVMDDNPSEEMKKKMMKRLMRMMEEDQ